MCIFLAFNRCLELNCGNVPFIVTQIGSAFLNEIAPSSEMVRVREVTLAEIEYFVKEDRNDPANCAEVAHLQLPLSRGLQKNVKSKKLGLELPEFEIAELGLRCTMA